MPVSTFLDKLILLSGIVDILSSQQILFACAAFDLSLPLGDTTSLGVLPGDIAGTAKRGILPQSDFFCTNLRLNDLEGVGEIVLPTASSALE